MENIGLYGVFFSIIFIGFLYVTSLFRKSDKKQNLLDEMTPDQRAVYDENQKELRTFASFGPKNEHLICPHCQTKGVVRAKSVSRTVTSTGTVGGF